MKYTAFGAIILLFTLSGCVSQFTELEDVPSTYAGSAGKVATVNPTETGLVFQDANGGSGNDTNCSNNPNCVLTGRLNSTFDANAEDYNGVSLTLQQPGGLKFIYNTTLQKALEIPFPTGCTEVFGVAGFAQTGLEFCASPIVGIMMRLLATPVFAVMEGGTNIGSMYLRPQSWPLSQPPTIFNGAVMQWADFIDGNRLMCYSNSIVGWHECGTYQTNYGRDFRFQTGDFNNLSDKNQLRFLGAVDFNNTIDINGQGNFTQNLSTDQNLNVDGNINLLPGKSITGFIYTFVGGNTVSCNTICNSADGNSFGNLTCIDSIVSTSGAHNLCSGTVGQRTCICQN